MAGRRVLVIGSQNAILGELPFLPRVAERLHTLMTTGPGELLGVKLNGRTAGLLIDPTVEETKSAIAAAVDAAAIAGDALVIAYVGHGDVESQRFYLRPIDSDRPTPQHAVDLVQLIGNSLLEYDNFTGLTVLVDACHGGNAVRAGMEVWGQLIRSLKDFEFLSPTDDIESKDAVLFEALCRMLERGDPSASDRLTAADVARSLEKSGWAPQHATFNRAVDLGRNNAKDPGDVFWNWKRSPSRPDILQRTLHFQPTAALRRLVEAAEAAPVVLLAGSAGTGKSTLAAALARPELTDGAVPSSFIQAITVLNAQTNENELAVDLETQLRRTVPDFAGAVDEFQRSLPLEERKRLDYVSQKVVRPLAHLPAGASARIMLDGFDQLSELMRKTVADAFAKRPASLRLIVTAHPETRGFPDARALLLGPELAVDGPLNAYLKSRGVGPPARTAILAKSAGLWLATELLADAVLADPNIDLGGLPGTVAEAYRQRLAQVTGGTAAAWRDRFGPVLSLLAAAGVGPVLPLPLLVHASASLRGPSTADDVRVTLDALGGLVVRGDARSPTEHAGLFHAALVEYLLSPTAANAGFNIDAPAAHRAMTVAIDALAPRAKRLVDDPWHRYAFLREPLHLWEAGEVNRAYDSLLHRESNIPPENLARWEEWLARSRGWLREEDPRVLYLRSHVAFWTGKCGDARGALALFAALLPDRERALGRDHPDVLATRGNVAIWTGECGDARGALALFAELLPDQERALGRVHPDVLTTRNNVAFLTGKCGDARGALALFGALLPDQERVLGRDHPDVLTIRNSVAARTGECGDARGALALFAALLPDRERVLGRDHPDSLNTIGFLGVLSITTGNQAEGCRWLRDGAARARKRFGPEHPLTRQFEDLIRQYRCGSG